MFYFTKDLAEFKVEMCETGTASETFDDQSTSSVSGMKSVSRTNINMVSEWLATSKDESCGLFGT